jgi:hypothetical protein
MIKLYETLSVHVLLPSFTSFPSHPLSSSPLSLSLALQLQIRGSNDCAKCLRKLEDAVINAPNLERVTHH